MLAFNTLSVTKVFISPQIKSEHEKKNISQPRSCTFGGYHPCFLLPAVRSCADTVLCDADCIILYN